MDKLHGNQGEKYILNYSFGKTLFLQAVTNNVPFGKLFPLLLCCSGNFLHFLFKVNIYNRIPQTVEKKSAKVTWTSRKTRCLTESRHFYGLDFSTWKVGFWLPTIERKFFLKLIKMLYLRCQWEKHCDFQIKIQCCMEKKIS